VPVDPNPPVLIHRDQRRGHGFGAGTKVKLVSERDPFCAPSLSNPCDTLGDDPLAPQNGGSHAETFGSPAEYRFQDGIDIDRRTVLRLPVSQTRWFHCGGFWRFAHHESPNGRFHFADYQAVKQ